MDRLELMELHNTEVEVLRGNLGKDPRVSIHHRDGFSGLVALTPPEPRRGLALIDPSYELAEDYGQALDCLLRAHKRWPVGVLALWYPVIARRESELGSLISGLSGIVDAPTLRAELGVRPYEGGSGLVASGLFIVNPPWLLDESLREALPWLAANLATEGPGSFSVTLTGER
jgi:23S rRNA (adenine2030-N6)-methyltransferase